MKTLIAYFSHTGTTKKAAEQIQSVAGGDFYEIKGEKNYGSFARACAIGGKERMTGECPAITTDLDNFDSYDRIFLGFPLWYGSYPRIIQTFLNAHDFAGKEVYPFCTSTRAGAEKSGKDLQKALPGAKVHTALRIDGQDDKAIEAWI